MKKCEMCLIVLDDGFFYHKMKCYKCVYKSKISLVKRTKVKKICKICGKILSSNRRAYCDDKCYQKGLKIKRKEYVDKMKIMIIKGETRIIYGKGFKK